MRAWLYILLELVSNPFNISSSREFVSNNARCRVSVLSESILLNCLATVNLFMAIYHVFTVYI